MGYRVSGEKGTGLGICLQRMHQRCLHEGQFYTSSDIWEVKESGNMMHTRGIALY